MISEKAKKYNLMKIAFISSSNYNGGADLSANKFFNALKHKELKKFFFVRFKESTNSKVVQVGNLYINKLRSLLFLPLKKIIGEKDYSLNLLYSNFFNKKQICYFDIFNFNWLGSETISLNEIKKIRKPIVFTLHDQWLFYGGEHYFNYLGKKRNFVFNLINKNLKKKKKFIFNNKNIYFICPSQWIANTFKQYKTLDKNNIKIIPYPVNKKIFKPLPQSIFRKKFKINSDKKIGLFMTASHLHDPRKGFDLLQKSLNYLDDKDFEILIVGSKKNNISINQKYFFFENKKSKFNVSRIINCSDFLLFPSKADNLPNIVLESLACHKPVVAYKIGGIKEVVKHKYNGYLAKPFDKKDFSNGINYVLKNYKKLSKNISKDISFKKYIDENRIQKEYFNFFKKIIKNYSDH